MRHDIDDADIIGGAECEEEEDCVIGTSTASWGEQGAHALSLSSGWAVGTFLERVRWHFSGFYTCGDFFFSILSASPSPPLTKSRGKPSNSNCDFPDFGANCFQGICTCVGGSLKKIICRRVLPPCFSGLLRSCIREGDGARVRRVVPRRSSSLDRAHVIEVCNLCGEDIMPGDRDERRRIPMCVFGSTRLPPPPSRNMFEESFL